MDKRYFFTDPIFYLTGFIKEDKYENSFYWVL